MKTKLNVWQWIIVSLLILLVVQYIWNYRQVANLREIANTVLEEKKVVWEKKVDSLITALSEIGIDRESQIKTKDSILQVRQQYLNRAIQENKYLNNKLLEYEKNLPYGDRNLDDALDVFTRYRYKGNTTTAEEN